MFLKVSPLTGVGRALKARKLTPKYLGPYQILKKIGPVPFHDSQFYIQDEIMRRF